MQDARSYNHPLFIICLLLVAGGLCAQDREEGVFRHLGKRDGLLQSTVFALAQDSTGLLWFGTRGGINAYDGYRFSVVNEKDDGHPGDHDTRTLYVDPLTHDVLAGSLTCLWRYSARTGKARRFEHHEKDTTTITGGSIRCALRDASGQLWVGTAQGLNLLDDDGGTVRRFYPHGSPGPVEANHIAFLTEGRGGKLYVGTRAGLYLLDQGSPGGFQFVVATGTARLRASAWDPAGNLWLGTLDAGVIRYHPGREEVARFAHEEGKEQSLSHNNVRALAASPTGDIWVATFDGLNRLRAGDTGFTRFRHSGEDDSGLRDNSIWALLFDRSGSLWVGTYYGGVHHFDPRFSNFISVRHRRDGNSLSGNVVSCFAEEPNGNLWIGTEGDGLNYYDSKTGRYTVYSSDSGPTAGLPGNNVKHLHLDGDDLWIGTFREGFARMDTRTRTFRTYRHDPEDDNSVADNKVYGLHREGDLLYVLTFGGGLDVLDTKTDRFRHFVADADDPESISSNDTRVLLRTRRGTFWIGTERGLNRVHTNARGYPTYFTSHFLSDKIYSLYEDDGEWLWIGTFANGLYRYDPTTGIFQHYTAADGLAGNTVFGILPGAGGELWLSTENGISRFDRPSARFTNYDYSSGLENLEYNFNAYHRTQRGELLFGGLNGYTRFYPADITPNTFVPPVAFTGLIRNNREVRPGDESDLLDVHIDQTESLTFPYGEAAFTLQFAALDYFSPESNRYAYMLDGLESGWNYSTGDSEASYTIQRGGEYTFLLRGANSDGIWNDRVRRLKIVVLPPPWRTWWAYLIYAVILALVLYATLHFLRLRQHIKLQEIAKRQQNELTEMKLRFFTNITHEFRTPLTLIIGPLRQLLQESTPSAEQRSNLNLIQRNTTRLLNLVNQVLTFRKLVTDHEPMHPVKVDPAAFLAPICETFRDAAKRRRIRYAFIDRTEGQSVWLDPVKMEKVFYNLLSNAFKFTPDGGRIELVAEPEAGSIRISVRDSGPGVSPEDRPEIFKRFYEKSVGQQSNLKSSGIGLAISKQMVELHDGSLYVNDEFSGPWGEDRRGAEFVVVLKTGTAHLQKLELQEVSTMVRGQEQTASSETAAAGPDAFLSPISAPAPPPGEAIAYKLLVVDDNADIRKYLRSLFEHAYEVYTAESGVEGLRLARRHLPDLIVSDVMMPEMDGLEFTRAVKTDLEISHIPVLLLTARTAQPHKIEGLRIGADDYVTKPFDPEELQLRVANLLAIRREARQKFARVLSLDPSEVTITNADEEFLDRALSIVEDEMGNYDFKVEQFATRLAVSRSLLFTKMKALTGDTPNNFIKSIRMKRAAQLLATGELNVSQVAYEVGFKDPKYFRRCFKAAFDEVPSNYGKVLK